MRRSLRDRRRVLADDFDDPVVGIVNLFDIAMVFAVALVVALAFSSASPLDSQRPVPDPETAPDASAAGGRPVGQVLQLPDGSLVYELQEGR